VLGSILLLAGDSSTVLEGSVQLLAYSMGLAVPFLVAGAVFAPAMGAFRWLRDRMVVIQAVSGGLLVALGALLFFERFYWIRIYLNRLFEWLGIEGL
jgi:cytochrome c-type biogenesis protein